MMALQFSYAPFHYDQETMDILRAMLKLREKWLPYMLETIDKSLEIKEPPFRSNLLKSEFKLADLFHLFYKMR